MACHPEQPFTAAQEERIRQMIVDGINEATRQRNREASERMRRETAAPSLGAAIDRAISLARQQYEKSAEQSQPAQPHGTQRLC